MAGSIDTFHHLGIVTRDLEASVARYQRLGFMLTPLSFPEFPLSPGGNPERVGVANRHAIFRNSYLEMLGVVDAGRWASISTAQRGAFDIDRPLQRYEGLHVMHYGTDDIERCRARLLAQGLDPSPIQPFQRTVATPGGSAMMRARRLSFPAPANPEALFQIVQHDTPELVLQPRYMAHPNGAFSLSGAILCVEDVNEVSDRYARYAGHPVEGRGELRMIDLGEARVVVDDPSNLSTLLPGESVPALPYLAGIMVAADMGHVAQFLHERNIKRLAHRGTLIVSARDASGCAVVFECGATH